MPSLNTDNGSLKLLLIDDNPTFLRAATQFIQRHKYLVVVGTSSWQDGLHLAYDLQPDLILLDLMMPGQSGLGLIPMLRTALPRTGIIVLTLHTEESIRRQVECAGAHGFVAKSQLTTDLLPIIQQVYQEIIQIEQ